jgi:sugar phosphate isomerase/epimerase
VTALSYCTNVHPAEDLAGVLRQLDAYAVPVRERLGSARLGLGLWLAADVAAGLAADKSARVTLRTELDARDLDVLTLNAFPYGGFHDDVVKHAVYRPNWTEQARVAYTKDCAAVLADLLADDADYGSISTLPLGWREPWSPSADRTAEGALDEVSHALRAATLRCGRPITLAVEPEPGCVLDTVADTVGWLAKRVDGEYVGLCLDTCHLAVSFADPAGAVAAVYAAGLRVMKVQVSSALEVPAPADPLARAALVDFAEPRYLHQVRELTDGGVLAGDDLPEALAELPGTGPWRVHFHIPLHAAPPAPLRSTTDVIRQSIDALRSTVDGSLPHLEVETYTWSVLPGGQGDDLIGGIAAELAWAQRLVPEGVAG